MPAAKLVLRIDQGATLERYFDVFGRTGAPVDVTGHTFRGQIRSKRSGRPLLLEMSIANGKIRLDPAVSNRIWLVLQPTDTIALPAGFLDYDILWIQPDGQVDRMVFGEVCVSRTVTR